MPRWTRCGNMFGMVFMSLWFAGLGLLSTFLIVRRGPQPRGLIVSSIVVMAFTVFAIGGLLWFHRRTISKFTYDGNALRFRTLGIAQMQTRNVSEIVRLSEWRGRGGFLGYKLRFRDGAKAYLQYSVSNVSPRGADNLQTSN